MYNNFTSFPSIFTYFTLKVTNELKLLGERGYGWGKGGEKDSLPNFLNFYHHHVIYLHQYYLLKYSLLSSVPTNQCYSVFSPEVTLYILLVLRFHI